MWFLVIILGLAAGLFDYDWPPAEAVLFLAALAVALLKKHHITMGLVILAYLYSNVYLAVLFNGLFPQHLAGQELSVQGVVVDVLQQQPERQQLLFRVDHCLTVVDQQKNCHFNGQVVLNRDLLKPQPGQKQKPDHLAHLGERWHFVVRLYPVRGFMNPGQSRYRLMQLAKGVKGRGYVRHELFSQRLSQAPWHYRTLSHWRSAFSARVDALKGLSPAASSTGGSSFGGSSSGVSSSGGANSVTSNLVTALLTGRTDDLTSHQWSLLQTTGTVHLVVVSGLHLGVLLGGGWLLLSLLPRLVPLDRRRHRLLLLTVPIILLLPMLWIWPSGVAISRALMMALVVLALRGFGILLSPWRILLLVVVLLLLSQPLYLLRPGFYYSILAVALLLFVVSGGRHKALFLHIQLVLLLGLLPVQSFWLNSPDLVSGLANLVAIPLVSVIILPFALLLLWVPFPIALEWLQQLEQVFWQWLELCVGLNWGYWSLDLPTSIALLLTALVLGLPALPFRRAWLLAVLVLFISTKTEPELNQLISKLAGADIRANVRKVRTDAQADFMVQVFDVGQGLSVRIKSGDQQLVYDAGPKFRSGFMPIEMVLPPLLRSEGAVLDYLVISHNDNDHAGGLESLAPFARLIVVGQTGLLDRAVDGLIDGLVDAPIDSLDRADQAEPNVILCTAGQQWQMGEVSIRVLYPPAFLRYDDMPRSDNEYSCVLHLQSKRQPDKSLLLTGDIDQQAEQWLLNSGQNLKAKWLIASHHGSASGNSLAFLAEVNPEGVIYSAGFNNSYGHPSKKVLERMAYLRSISIAASPIRFKEYNTADLGAITLSSTPHHKPFWLIEGRREQIPLRWLWQP